ncbi:MAG: OmpA family protein [Mucilaginibacter sp.]|nr:OmpA family protein [Mucilaginibacter sp.]
MKTRILKSVAILLLISVNAIASGNVKTSAKAALRHKLAMSIADMTKNLQFDFASAQLRPEYAERLTELAKLLKEDGSPIALRGHADAIGQYVPNWKLSEKRADAVRDFLVKQGVSEEKIVTTPFGSTIPIASNKTPAGRQKNRRVEIKLG